MAIDLARDSHRRGNRGADMILSAGSVSIGYESIHYAASGIAEAGPAILFLHEAGGSGATWHGQLAGLAQRARCLVPDLPGHGQSTGGGLQTISEHRTAMLGFLDALAIRWPVVVVGVCLGAAVGIDLALHAPERVAGLILAGLAEGSRASPILVQQTARGEAPEEFVEGMFSESASPRLKREQLKRWRLTCPTVRHGDLMALARYPVRDRLEQVRHRTLAVAGGEDRVLPVESTRRLAARTLRGETVVIPAAGSLSMLEQPERFNQVVVDFLEEVHPDVPVVPAVHYVGGYRRSRVR